MALLDTDEASNNGLKSVVTRLTEPTALKLNDYGEDTDQGIVKKENE
jgi:hypothetical protein